MDVIILIGLQASGKTSFAIRHFADLYDYVSKDRFRNAKKRQRRQERLIERALQSGRSVVVDNTNATVEARAPVIELGRRYGARIIGFYFESSVPACLERNRARRGKERVPDVAIFTTVSRLEPPSCGEDFDRLYHVSIDGDGNFRVQDWKEE